jgi:rubrerythrin
VSENEARSQSALRELSEDPTSRKRFLRGVGGGGAAAALGVLLAACGKDKSSSTTTGTTKGSTKSTTSADVKNDIEIVNYALTLEFLEAQFYSDVIDSGLVKDPKVASLAKKFGETEQLHVDALTSAVKGLGGTPVSKPSASFQSVLDGGLKKVLETAATVENLGAAAYLGQAGNIKSKDILAAALSIHSVEARHAAALNELVGRGFKGSGSLSGSLPDGAFAKPMSKAEVLAQVKPFLQS